MSQITTHVLDTSTGKPASDMEVTLEHKTGEASWRRIASGVTDADGRIKDLLPSDIELSAGEYKLIFKTGGYFHMRQTECFFSQITIVFTVSDVEQHFHVPLLLSPFGYSTYRGT